MRTWEKKRNCLLILQMCAGNTTYSFMDIPSSRLYLSIKYAQPENSADAKNRAAD